MSRTVPPAPMTLEQLYARCRRALDALAASARQGAPIPSGALLESVEHIDTYIDALHLLIVGPEEDA